MTPPEEIIEGRDTPHFFAEYSRKLIGHCGCIVIKADDNRVAAKGTATFLRKGAERRIITADHVVDAMQAANPGTVGLLLPALDARGELATGVVMQQLEVDVNVQVLWRSKEYDAAVLDAAFVPEAQVRWFDLENSITICQRVRELWRLVAQDGEGSLPFSIGGFAEWGHVRDEAKRVEIVSGLPLFAYVTEWDEPYAGKAPQIYIEIVAGSRGEEELVGLSELHRTMARQMSEAENPLGGYSGGPLALFDPKGVHLLGVVKEGAFTFGVARGFCSAIDDIAGLSGLTG